MGKIIRGSHIFGGKFDNQFEFESELEKEGFISYFYSEFCLQVYYQDISFSSEANLIKRSD